MFSFRIVGTVVHEFVRSQTVVQMIGRVRIRVKSSPSLTTWRGAFVTMLVKISYNAPIKADKTNPPVQNNASKISRNPLNKKKEKKRTSLLHAVCETRDPDTRRKRSF